MKPNTPLSLVERDLLPETMQGAHDRSIAVRDDATFIRALGNAPELFDWYSEFYQRLFSSGRVDAPLKELLRYRLSTRHGCLHCNLGNRRDALAAGLSAEKLDAISNLESDLFDGRERGVLKLAEEMALTNRQGELSKELHGELRGFFDDAEILELGMVSAVLVGMAKFLFVFDLVEREANCPFPHKAEATR